MAKKSVRLSVGAIFTKGPGKIYFYRYQLKALRKNRRLILWEILRPAAGVVSRARAPEFDQCYSSPDDFASVIALGKRR